MFSSHVIGDAPLFEKFYVGDFTDLLPDRVLDLNFDRRAAPNFLGTDIVEVRYGQYAAKIDDLPMLNVDDELLKYGATISSTLRAISVNAGKAGMQQKVLSANAQEALVGTPGNYYGAYGYNRWGAVRGYTYYRPNFAYVSNYGQITNLMAAGVADEKAMRDQTWKNIDDSSAQIRRKMTAKYQVEF